MDPAQVLAVEVRQFVGGDLQTLVPQVIGQTAASEQKKSGSRPPVNWDERTFLQSATEKWNLTEEQLHAMQCLLEFSRKRADDLGWGAGRIYGSFSPKFLKVSPRSLYTVQADGRLTVNFAWLDHTEEEKTFRERFADELKTIPAFASRIKQPDGYSGFTIEEWRGEVDKFISVVDKIVP